MNRILSRQILAIGVSFGFLVVVVFWGLISQYSAIYNQGDAQLGAMRALAGISTVQEQIRRANSADEIRRIFRNSDSSMTKANIPLEKVRAVYGNYLAHYSEKPKEVETKVLQAKKREFLELLQQKARRDRADIASSSLIASIVADAQRNYWQENLEQDELFLRKVKDKLTALQSVARVKTDINEIMESHAKLGNIVSNSSAWLSKRAEYIQTAEKQTQQLIDELRRGTDSTQEEMQKSFILHVLMSMVMVALAGALLFFTYKRQRRLRQKEIASLHLRLKGLQGDESDTLSSEWDMVVERVRKMREDFQHVDDLQTTFEQASVASFYADSSGGIKFSSAKAKELFPDAKNIQDIFSSKTFSEAKKILHDFSRIEAGQTITEWNQDGQLINLEISWKAIQKGSCANGIAFTLLERTDEKPIIYSAIASAVEPLLQDSYSGKVHPLIQPLMEQKQSLLREIQEMELHWREEVKGLTEQLAKVREFRENENRAATKIRSEAQELLERVSGYAEEERSQLTDIHVLHGNFHLAKQCQIEIERYLKNRRRMDNTQAWFVKKLRAEHGAIQDAFEMIESDMAALQMDIENAKMHRLNFSLQSSTPEDTERNLRNCIQAAANAKGKIEQMMNLLRNFISKSIVSSNEIKQDEQDDGPNLQPLLDALLAWDSYADKWQRGIMHLQANSTNARDNVQALLSESREVQEWNKRSSEINEKIESSLSRWS